jgi:hypothetical protein
MRLALLAHLNMEPYKPFYHISTKAKSELIRLDAVIEAGRGYDWETQGLAGPSVGAQMPEEREMVFVYDEEETVINKDWLIRAKRMKGSKEYKSLQNKFFIQDDSE